MHLEVTGISHGTLSLTLVTSKNSNVVIVSNSVGEMDPKWGKNRVFSIYWKIWLLIFTEFDI